MTNAVMHERELPEPPLCGRSDQSVFTEPWEAQAFAMTLALHERGFFTWSEWTQTLGRAIKDAQANGDPDTGKTYYSHWLRALEQILTAKHLVGADQLMLHQQAWLRAARRTPHGSPIDVTPLDLEG